MMRFTIQDLLDLKLSPRESLRLSPAGCAGGSSRVIAAPKFGSPESFLKGDAKNIDASLIQLIGIEEQRLIEALLEKKDLSPLARLFSSDCSCCIFTDDLSPAAEVIALSEREGMPLFQTPLGVLEFSARLSTALAQLFAVRKVIHATLLEVSGLGVLLRGKSGVGKSETALELVNRGHRLVADDLISLQAIEDHTLMGEGVNPNMSHHMEIRGLGIISIFRLFGVRAVRERKQVQMVVELEEWKDSTSYDRTGLQDSYMEILGIKIPFALIPVKPGRNIATIVETAALGERLKKQGYHQAKEFDKMMRVHLKEKAAKGGDLSS